MSDLGVMSIGKSDRDAAVELREAVRGKLADILPLMDQANRSGMRIEFALAIDAFGKNFVQRLAVVKEIG